MKLIYCDESCHLENDGNDIMVLGAISCDDKVKKDIFNEIRAIKEKHGISPYFEIKWTKVSNGKIDMYKELIEYFFDKKELEFRGVVAKGKKKLDHKKYNSGDYNKWYYKMYFLLLNHMISKSDNYRIFIDIKDTNGGSKVRKLHEVLCNKIYDFEREIVKKVEQIHSDHSEILQLTDLIIGAFSYYHRGLNSSESKLDIIKLIKEKSGYSLNGKSEYFEKKFNYIVWEGRR
ncbi:hypothetical protein PM10SUCC1_18960 [Propionigenium maris DSM 9537]|uniref:DUF3800 domain-containing protein n=1 Tax=Propionigenium maris DSM 9537 TaxID=1123000 RepID=A0A9W6GMN9_9FUSO|nr:DUF3800 domain-containing protein [Propionigenium maris]GLI56382.1 hypothetical protein PM10SUCC1_18960 [Propionigenium maris DSM 9537]